MNRGYELMTKVQREHRLAELEAIRASKGLSCREAGEIDFLRKHRG